MTSGSKERLPHQEIPAVTSRPDATLSWRAWASHSFGRWIGCRALLVVYSFSATCRSLLGSYVKFAITGASGQLGRLVTDRLVTLVDPTDVILISRTPDAVESIAGTSVRAGDFARPDTLAEAFDGVDTLLLISTNTVGIRLDQQRTAIGAAVAAGVTRVLYTSIPNPVRENPAFVVPDHAGTETALRDSGMQWVALRNNLYAHMQLPGIKRAATTGRFVTNQGDGRAAYVTREDCAAVAAAAMTQDSPANQVYDVTGPEAFSAADLAMLAGDNVEVVSVTDDEYAAGLLSADLPESLARGLTSFGASIREGYLATISPVVADVTGQPATSLRSLLA